MNNPNFVQYPLPPGYFIQSASTGGRPTFKRYVSSDKPRRMHGYTVKRPRYVVNIRFLWSDWSVSVELNGEILLEESGYPDASSAAVAMELRMYEELNI